MTDLTMLTTLTQPAGMISLEDETALMNAWVRSRDAGKPDMRVLSRIVHQFTPIISRCAKTMAGYQCERADLYAEGYVALVNCAYNYDPSMEYKFATFVMSSVRGVMLQFVSRNKFIVNVCTEHRRKKLFFQMRRFVRKYQQETGSFMMTEELAALVAEKFQLPVSEVYNMDNMLKRPTESLSAPIHTSAHFGDSDWDETKGDRIVDECPNPEVACATQETLDDHSSLIETAMQRCKLTPRQRRIFCAQILAEPDEVITLQALGEEFGISKERVRQIREMTQAKVSKELRRMVPSDQVKNLFI